MASLYSPQHIKLLAQIRSFILANPAQFADARKWLLDTYGPDAEGVCRPDRAEYEDRQRTLAACLAEMAKPDGTKYPEWQLDDYRKPPTQCENPMTRAAFLAVTLLLKEASGRFDETRAAAILLLAVAMGDKTAGKHSNLFRVFGDWTTDEAWPLWAANYQLINGRLSEWMEMVEAQWVALSVFRPGEATTWDPRHHGRTGKVTAGECGTPFDNVSPHKHLPIRARESLWAACQLVLARPADFALALAWLNEDYSEHAALGRMLRDSEQSYRIALRQLRTARDRCDTFPRRRVLRAGRPELERSRRLALLREFWSVEEIGGVPDAFADSLLDHPERVREWVVQLTIHECLLRGRRLRGDQCVITNDRKPDDAIVDATNVAKVWRSLDQHTLEAIKHYKTQRRERDAECRRVASEKRERLWMAVQDAVRCGLRAGKGELVSARRVVLLGCLLSYQHALALPGELAQWQWDSDFMVAGGYAAGRETVLFHPFGDGERPESSLVWMPDADRFLDLLSCALNVCQRLAVGDHAIRGAGDEDGPFPPSGFAYAGQKAALTPTEWKLVSHLWNATNRTAAVADIENSVWGDEADTDVRIKSAVKRASEKLQRLGWEIRRKAGFYSLSLIAGRK